MSYTINRSTLPQSQDPGRRIQSPPSQPTLVRTIVIYSFHLHLGFPSDLLPSPFPTQLYYIICNISYVRQASHSLSSMIS